MSPFEEIELLERQFSDPASRMNIAHLGNLISDEFEEYSSSGNIIRKQDVLNWLAAPNPVPFEYTGFRFRQLSDTCILTTYISSISGKRAFRSSIWRKENSGWRMLHHQATVLTDSFS